MGCVTAFAGSRWSWLATSWRIFTPKPLASSATAQRPKKWKAPERMICNCIACDWSSSGDCILFTEKSAHADLDAQERYSLQTRFLGLTFSWTPLWSLATAPSLFRFTTAIPPALIRQRNGKLNLKIIFLCPNVTSWLLGWKLKLTDWW